MFTTIFSRVGGDNVGVKKGPCPVGNFTFGTVKLATVVVLLLVSSSVAIDGATVLTDVQSVVYDLP